MARLRITTIMTGLVGTVALLGTTMLFAATPESHADAPAMHHTQASKSIPDLKDLIGKVENRYGGKVVGIERQKRSGLYEVKILGSNGHEQEFHVNSAGEKVARIHHHSSKHESGKS